MAEEEGIGGLNISRSALNLVAIKGRRLETFFSYDPGYCWHRMMRITGQVRAYCLKDEVKRGSH